MPEQKTTDSLRRGRLFRLPLVGACVLPVVALADDPFQHNGVDKVYHPYVQPLETEIEYRSVYQTDGESLEDGVSRHRLAIGRALTDRVFVEGYLIGKESPQDDFYLDRWELETKIQLTEQGEYWADWGLLFEFERARSESITETAAVVLMEKEVSPSWITTMNFRTEYEFGSDIANEWDFDVAAQLRYRFSERFEPSVEYYADEFTSALGPVFQGVERLGIARKFYWEAGVLFPLNDTTPDSTFRFMLEFEF
ncbi:MAG: hypothetical protein R3F41_03035 [Gammaproteobacteria bacterium]|nr:hypothetical protein [Pseudomonadales bacterium]